MLKRDDILSYLRCALLLVLLFPVQLHGQDRPALLEVDADHRLRMVHWDARLFPSRGWEGWFTRHRTRAGVTWNPSSEFRLRVSLANEFFAWYRHPDKPDFTLDEIFFDNLYLQWKPEDLPLEVTLGRQNMPLGEGFVVMDGGPLDGSRSIYFNAVRADIHPAADHRITLFAMHQPEQDNLLPRIHDSERPLFEDDKYGAGAQYEGSLGEHALGLYYLYTDQRDIFHHIETRAEMGLADKHLHILGLHGGMALMPGLSITAEAAMQDGAILQRETERDWRYPQRTWAWYAYCTWSPWHGDAGMPSLRGGWYQYSGGYDTEEDINHDWDPLFARWPKWSESFIYTLVSLRGSIAYWSNLSVPWMEVQWAPVERIALRTLLQQLSAQSGYREGDSPVDIGTLLIVEVKFQPLDRLSGHLLLERMWYADGHPTITAEEYLWTRFELQYRWSDVLLR